jgi:hypothetical protein
LRLVWFGWCYRGWGGFSVAHMATTTSAKAARKAARESALEANAELARRTKLNVDDLTTFFASMSRADGVDDWLNEKIRALKEQAAKRRDSERRDAGAALAKMRERGEQVRDIARLARISEKQVRDLIRHAEAVRAAEVDALEAAGEASIEPRTTSTGGPAGPGVDQPGSTDHEAARLAPAVGQ